MNKLDKQYTDLLQDILENGVTKQDRTGTGIISVFGRQIRHNMKDGFPLLTTKKMPFKTIATELLWFLRGDTNIKFLVNNGCHIWDGDAYKRYQTETMFNSDNKWLNELDGINLGTGEKGEVYRQFIPEEFINKIKTDAEFAKKWGELGPIYGKQWRQWVGYEQNTKIDGVYSEYAIDQIQNLINDLKTNPDSRRLMVNAWNVGELDQMVLPPCHYGFQVYTRELSIKERLEHFEEFFDCTPNSENMNEHEIHIELSKSNIPTRAISLMWNQRSVDTFLGLPFNIASYGLLLEIIAKEVNMVPDELIGNLGDVHLYSNHIEQAKEQIGKELSLEERLVLADIFNPLIREDCLTKTHHEDEIEELKLQYRNEWLDSLGVIPKRTRQPFPLPTLKLGHFGSILENLSVVDLSDFILENYQSHPTIKAPLSN
jgi:thymidylate synthase